MSAAMQAYIAVRQGRLMERWLLKRRPVPVYTWNADQDVCLAAFVLEHHELLERSEGTPLLRWIVQYNNKIDLCGGIYPVNLAELVDNHFTWVFEPYRLQRMHGKTQGDDELVMDTIRQVCERLQALLEGKAGTAPITAQPEILYRSPYNFVIADEKGDPTSRLVLASKGYTNLISLVCTRPNGRRTYSIIRGSPYDEDVFQVSALLEAFQAAEDQPDVRIWGGSNLAAGSDSELGSSLSWTQIRDIAEPIVSAAFRKNVSAQPVERGDVARSGVLLVMPPVSQPAIREQLMACGMEVFPVSTCSEARKVLNLHYQLTAVFCALQLCDGGYEDIVQMARERTSAVPVFVCAPRNNGDAKLALKAGAAQVVLEPYERAEVQQAVNTALTWRDDRETEPRP
jgi:CheY-like chemotaxis protein